MGVSKLNFTVKQGQYLVFIYAYTEINRVPPSEADMQRYFTVSPPTIHQRVKKLHASGLIARTPGQDHRNPNRPKRASYTPAPTQRMTWY